jgi:hypothetical protein
MQQRSESVFHPRADSYFLSARITRGYANRDEGNFRASWSLPKMLEGGHSSERLSPLERANRRLSHGERDRATRRHRGHQGRQKAWDFQSPGMPCGRNVVRCRLVGTNAKMFHCFTAMLRCSTSALEESFMRASEKDRLAAQVADRWVDFEMALSDKRKYPVQQFRQFWEVGRR